MKRKYNTRSSKNKKTKDESDDDMSDFIVPDDVVEYDSDVSDIPDIDVKHEESDDVDNDIEWMEKMGKTFSLLWEFRPSNLKKKLKEKEEYFIDEEDIDEESDSEEESDYETMDEEELEEKFLKKLSKSEKKELKEKEKEIGKYRDNKVPMKFRILRSTIPNDLKAKCLDELDVLQNMDSSTGEYNKKMRWLDYIINIPWSIYVKPKVTLKSSVKDKKQYLIDIKKKLDEATYGQSNAKSEILQYMAREIISEGSGRILALHGDFGVGKTSLIRDGVAKALGRPFNFIALGGATNSVFLDGSEYVYEGSSPGKIVRNIISSKCMNSIFYLDELDKISQTKEGDEIIGVLTHLLDQSQNNGFHDKYLGDIDIDMSKVFFIVSYNHADKIPAVLRDRLFVVKVDGYNDKDKFEIAKRYILPKIFKLMSGEDELIITDEVLRYIISRSSGDKGVRALKHHLESVIMKVNLWKFKSDELDLSYDLPKWKIPYEITEDIVNKLIKKNQDNSPPFGIYM